LLITLEYQEVVNEALIASEPLCQSTVAAAIVELDALVASNDFELINSLFK